MEFPKVDNSYWRLDEREEAENVGTALVNALRRVKADFDSVGIDGPCEECKRDDYRINFGWLDLPEAVEMTHMINATLDELEKYRDLVDAQTEP